MPARWSRSAGRSAAATCQVSGLQAPAA
jgi:hypothetical protein